MVFIFWHDRQLSEIYSSRRPDDCTFFPVWLLPNFYLQRNFSIFLRNDRDCKRIYTRVLILRIISRDNQKTDTTTQLYCTISMYVTPKTISCQNQKTNTTPQLYCTLSTKVVVCKTKTYFPPEPKTDTTAQLEKKFLQPTRSKCICSLSVVLSVSKG